MFRELVKFIKQNPKYDEYVLSNDMYYHLMKSFSSVAGDTLGLNEINITAIDKLLSKKITSTGILGSKTILALNHKEEIL